MALPLRIDPQALRQLRIRRGHTLKSLADRAGLNLNTIWRLESGTSGIQVTTLAALADALSVPIDELISAEDVA